MIAENPLRLTRSGRTSCHALSALARRRKGIRTFSIAQPANPDLVGGRRSQECRWTRGTNRTAR